MKIGRNLLVMVSGLALGSAAWAQSAYESAVLASGPLVYYPMSETAGSVVAFDAAAAAGLPQLGPQDGAYVNGVTLGVPGPTTLGLPGTAARYDGTEPANVEDYLDAGTLSDLGESFTVELWFRNLRPESVAGVISGYFYDRGGSAGVRIGINGTYTGAGLSGHLHELFLVLNGNVVVLPGHFGPVEGTWYHLALTREVTGGTAEYNLYIDGVAVLANHIIPVNPLSGASNLFGTRDDFRFPFQGDLDEAALYNRALSAAEINDHLEAALPAPIIIADAGPDQAASSGAIVQLNGCGSSGGCSALSFTWQQTSGPAVTLADPSLCNPTFTAPASAGLQFLTFALTASDDCDQSDTATVTVRLLADASSVCGYEESVLASGPLVYYRMEESAGALAAVDAADAGGAPQLGPHDGAYVSGVTLGVPGPALPGLPGTASSYGGLSGANQVYLDGGTLPDLGESFSVELWFRNTRPEAVSGVISGYFYDRGGTDGIRIGINGTYTGAGLAGHLHELFLVLNGNVVTLPGQFNPVEGTWYHLALTREVVGLSAVYNLYIDGAAVLTNYAVGLNYLYLRRNLFGARDDFVLAFQGDLDEAALYNWPLSAAEVSDHVLAAADVCSVDCAAVVAQFLPLLCAASVPLPTSNDELYELILQTAQTIAGSEDCLGDIRSALGL